MKDLMAKYATIKAITFPIKRITHSLFEDSISSSFSSHMDFTVAANIVGTAKKKENSAAAFRVSFCDIPPIIVAADRDTPGIIAILCTIPIIKAVL